MKKENDIELSATTKTNEDYESDAKKIQPRLSILDHVKRFIQFFTVEPFLLCYIMPGVISALAVQKLNMEKACRANLGFSEDICTRAVAGDVDDNITLNALNDAQVLVAEMTAWRQSLQSGLPAALILFVGAWSDKTGNRKLLMLIPIFGELISSFGMVLATYYFLEWPLTATGFIEGLPPALTGGVSVALMGSYSYIADVTSIDSRTLRVGIVAVIVTLGIPIGSAISGVLTQAVGYYGIFGISTLMYVLGFIHTYLRIHDVRRTPMEGTFCQKLFSFFNAWDTVSLLVKSSGWRLAQIILVILAHVVIVGPVFAEGAVLYLYTLKKFNMDIVDFSLFITYSVLMGLAGTAVAVALFSKYLKMHDALLGIIATACKVVSSFVYAFAPTRTWFFSGPAFDFFGNSGVTAIRSLGTKVVNADQVGKMCALIGLAEAVTPVIYTPIYSLVYSKTIETFPGAFYALGGIMTVPAFFIFIVLYILHKKQERDVVKNPAEKEMHAHDNDVTAL